MIITNKELEIYSTHLFSNNKIERKNARAQIIRHTDSFTNLPSLSKAEQSEFPNWHKLSRQIKAYVESNNFPYNIDVDKAGDIYQVFEISEEPLISHKDFPPSKDPCYIVAMPHTPTSIENLKRQVALLWDEGFDSTVDASHNEAKKRLAIVIGINYCHELNNDLNRKRKNYIQTALSVQEFVNMHVKIIAFNWAPKWINRFKKGIDHKIVKRFYRLLSDKDPQLAKDLNAKLMSQKCSAIPYQRIRNQISRSVFTRSFCIQMQHGQKERPSFLVSFDDDAIKLRTEDNQGLFTHYDALIKQHSDLKIASTGYYMENDDEEFVELASRVDLMARRAIASTLPNGCYFPEPNLIIKIDSPEDLRSKISFLRSKGEKKGLEFLGIIENLQLNKGDVRGRVVFGKRGAIRTTQPIRASLPRHIPKHLTPVTLNNSKNLSSLRSFCQSVLQPQKGFAASVTKAMPTGSGSAKNMALIAKLYTSLDPIEYSKDWSCWKEIYLNTVNLFINLYNKKVKEEIKNPRFSIHAKKIVQNVTDKPKTIKFLEKKFNNIWKARSLIEKGILNETEFRTLFITAINTNRIVYEFLVSRISQLPFAYPRILDLTT